ncbi:MAG: YkvA family protein [Bacteroidota bacterium]
MQEQFKANPNPIEGIIQKLSSGITMNDVPKILSDAASKREDIEKSFQKDRSNVSDMLHKIKLVFEMIKNKDFNMGWPTKVIALAALLYFIMPFDLSFDYIPFIGYLDDALVFSVAMRMISGEIERYSKFRRNDFQQKGRLDTRPVADNENTTTALTGAPAH